VLHNFSNKLHLSHILHLKRIKAGIQKEIPAIV